MELSMARTTTQPMLSHGQDLGQARSLDYKRTIQGILPMLATRAVSSV